MPALLRRIRRTASLLFNLSPPRLWQIAIPLIAVALLLPPCPCSYTAITPTQQEEEEEEEE